MRETWYELEDGRTVDPSDCTWDDKGNVLTHADGMAVKMHAAGVPVSRSVDVPELAEVPKATSEMRAAGKPSGRAARSGYKTRG